MKILINRRSHNGKEIVPDDENIIIKSEPDGSEVLILNKCTPENAGEIEATAVNDEGSISTKAPLVVLGMQNQN